MSVIREISVQLEYIRECFFRTLIVRIWRILQVCGTCFIKGNILDNLYLSSRKRSRLQIRLESLCIKKTKVKKSVVKDSVCIGAIRELFFDIRSVAAGLQDEGQKKAHGLHTESLTDFFDLSFDAKEF